MSLLYLNYGPDIVTVATGTSVEHLKKKTEELDKNALWMALSNAVVLLQVLIASKRFLFRAYF